jgi:hypothetical protein
MLHYNLVHVALRSEIRRFSRVFVRILQALCMMHDIHRGADY